MISLGFSFLPCFATLVEANSFVKRKYKSWGFSILHFSGRVAPTFVFHFYKSRGFSNTKVGARKPPYFCLRALVIMTSSVKFL